MTGVNKEKGTDSLARDRKMLVGYKNVLTCFPDLFVVDLFSGTLATVKSCVELPRHRGFIDWEIISKPFASSTKAKGRTNARQIFKKRLNISGTNELIDA